MKILKLRYKNINSLKGEHEINFSHDCFKEGVFLITGVTGSGKSSLLDVISMALYAQTPRLENRTISLMTQDCNDSFCEVSFEIKGEHYRSHFKQYKKDNRIVSEMEIYLDEELLTSGVTTVPSKVESLIGLNFKQFMQTMLLAQGSFDTFLKASVSERALILEKMTDTSVYADISKHIFQRAKEEDQNLKRMRDSLENVTLYDDETLHKLELKIKALTKEKSAFNMESLLHKIAQKKAFEELKVKVEEYKKEIEVLEKELIQHQDIEYRYQKFLNYSKAEYAKISQVRLLDRELSFTEKNFHRVEEEFSQKEKILEELMFKLEENEKKIANIKVKKTHLEQEFKACLEGEHLRQNYTLLVSKINELEKVKKALKEIKLETKVVLTEAPILESIALLEKKRVEFETLFKAYNLEQIEQQYFIVEKKVSSLLRKENLEKEKRLFEEKKKSLEKDLEQGKEEESALNEKKSVLKKSIEDLSVEQKANEKISNYEHDRSQLKENCPCPLCGSLEHPLFKDIVDLESLSKEIDEKKKEYDLLEKSIIANQKNLSELEIKLSTVEEDLIQNAREQGLLGELHGDLNAMQKEKADLNEKIQNIRYQKEEALQVQIKLKEKEKSLAELRLQVAKEKNRDEREELLVSDERELKYFLIKTLRLYGLELDGNSLMMLNKKREIFENLTNEMEKVALEIHPLESESIQMKSKKAYLDESIRSEKKRISTQKCDLLMLSQKRLSILEEQEIDVYDAKLEVEEKKIREEWDVYNRLKLQFNEKKSLYFSMLEEIEKKQNLKMLNLEALKKERERVSIREGQIDQELQVIRTQLKEDRVKREKFEKEEGSLEEQELLHQKWESLNELIGSEDGESYRLFAQSCTFKTLVELSNRHLEKLNKRYLLSLQEENSLELEVIDLFQNQSRRSVVTLSSGESFIVSLALALGLSDLVSQDIEINTLFLDEGFETLDEESLEEVLMRLQNLESAGRLIGIVSHVQALKENIPNQVQIIKNDNGLSSVSLVCG